MLAQHPSIPLHDLRELSFICQPGFVGVALFALGPYILYNMAAATGTLQTGEYLHVQKSYLNQIAVHLPPFPSHTLPHREFFSNPQASPFNIPTTPPLHHDLPRLQEYLKSLFSLLYCYEVVVRECGQDPRWEEEVVTSTRRVVGFC